MRRIGLVGISRATRATLLTENSVTGSNYGVKCNSVYCESRCRRSTLGGREAFDQGAGDVADGDVGFLDALGIA
jgi:hypothetical protein